MDKRKHQAMLRAFDAFSIRITERYAEARAFLAAGKYVEAQSVLASLAQSHARTSMSLRGVLVREGLLEEDNK
jgi:hypothetical protein